MMTSDRGVDHISDDSLVANDLTLEVLELCGFFDASSGDDISVRYRLIHLLSCVVSTLKEDRVMDLNRSGSSGLVELEESFEKVREWSSKLLESHRQNTRQIVSQLREMEQYAGAGHMVQVCQKLRNSFLIQIEKENRKIDWMLKALDVVYESKEHVSNLAGICDEVRGCLRRDQLLLQPDYYNLVAIVEEASKKRHNNEGDGLVFRDTSKHSLVNTSSGKTRQAARSEGVVRLDVSSAATIMDAVHLFLGPVISSTHHTSLTALLICGDEGSGKSYVCGEINHLASTLDDCIVIYPELSEVLLVSSVGALEDFVVSLFDAVSSNCGPSILILDGVERLIRLIPHFSSTLLSMLESLRQDSRRGSSTLVVCTCTDAQQLAASFDRTFVLSSPDAATRRSIIKAVFLGEAQKDFLPEVEGVRVLLNEAVDSTVGVQMAELMQSCRYVLSQAVPGSSPVEGLQMFKERAQTNLPGSLRQGIIEDAFEMRVLTARDLRSSGANFFDETSSTYLLPMVGQAVEAAWDVLLRTIVIPLCRREALAVLLGENRGEHGNLVCGGVLIYGDPNSGKTEISMHCAKYASFLNPKIRLLDVSCTSLIHKEVGGSEKAIRKMFDSARKSAPCILLLDGIENIGQVRGNDLTTEGTLDRVLSTVLTEMDGSGTAVGGSQEGIAVIGITYDENRVDPALKRPGRLQQTVRMTR